MDGASPNCLGSGRHGVRSELPTPTRRRRLVVEVAPNVVDVFAVALPGSPLFVTNVQSDGEGVLASHPWDSDEEDELDTHSRNRAGVPILGRVLVESRWIEDPPFSVPPTVPASSDATVGGRPRQSERSHDASIDATQADNDIDADNERHPPVLEDVVNVLESELAVEGDRSAEENTPVGSTVPASSGAVRRRLVLTSCTAGEPETTAPASPSALVVAGRAVDVPPTILDALEEDLGRFSPSVRVEVASNWRESNDRVAEVASLTPSRVEVEAPHQST